MARVQSGGLAWWRPAWPMMGGACVQAFGYPGDPLDWLRETVRQVRRASGCNVLIGASVVVLIVGLVIMDVWPRRQPWETRHRVSRRVPAVTALSQESEVQELAELLLDNDALQRPSKIICRVSNTEQEQSLWLDIGSTRRALGHLRPY
jgi:hypothetical protein